MPEHTPTRETAHFGDAAGEYRHAHEEAAVFDVSDRGKVEVTGKDAAAFLHNLCSNDVLHLSPGGSCEAFFLNVKARVVAHVVICNVPHPDRPAFWLDVAPGQAKKVVQHLDHFLISEQVELADRTLEYAQLHVAGPRAAEIVNHAVVAESPDSGRAVWVTADGLLVLRCDPLGLPGYDLVCPSGQAPALWERLVQAGARPAELEAYHALRIEAGTPVYGQDIDESHLGPEVGRTRQAISYAKGCYLGQEPVVRIRDLGQVNRTLLGLKVAGEGMIPPGAKLFRGAAEVGQVTSSAVSPRLGVIALAYVRRGSQEPGTVVEVDAVDGRRAGEVVALPFPGSVSP